LTVHSFFFKPKQPKGEMNMSAQENTQAIQNIYAAFGRGDIAAILNALASDVEWIHTAAKDVPFGGTYRGTQQVGTFFQKLAESQDFLAFEPHEFVAQADLVAVFGSIKARSKATGKVYETPWAMKWQLQNGKVTKLHHFFDSAIVEAAFRK
jgi:ketosteroid isomerase-like protein